MKRIYYLTLIFVSFQMYSQIGIGTTDPKATLDIREANPASPTAQAGIAIPQVSSLPSSGNRSGQIVFLTTTNMYYCYSSIGWQGLYTQVYNYGDVKYGYQSADHNGWFLLDGRPKSTLTANQQAVATSLGIGTYLPSISDKSIVGVSEGKALNSTGGHETVTIAQNQLPNVTLTTTTNGAHTHTFSTSSGLGLLSGMTPLLGNPTTVNTSSSGDHSHTTSSINGGVAQQSLNIQNPYLALNGFIYLGP